MPPSGSILELFISTPLPPLKYCPSLRSRPAKISAKQLALLMAPDFDLLFGGAAGGGKSIGLLMAALQYVHVPGYAAGLFRRTYKDLALPGALMDIAEQWFSGTDAHWDDTLKTWEFPTGGAPSKIVFGYLDAEKDKRRYQGSAFQYVGFDETTQFTETQVSYVISRVRRPAEDADPRLFAVPLRVRCASNPGGEGHEWVKARYVDPLTNEGRRFLPSKLEDNPFLDRASYEQSLAQLDPITREQLRHGDWGVMPTGGLFTREMFIDPQRGRVALDKDPGCERYVRRWDLASTVPDQRRNKDPDYTVGTLMGVKRGHYFVIDVRRFRKGPADTEFEIAQTAEIDGRGVPIRMEQEPGSSGVTTIDHYGRTVLRGYDFAGVRSTGDKVLRARPFSSAADRGLVTIVRGSWNNQWLDEHVGFPAVGHDDQVDSASGAHFDLTQKRNASRSRELVL